MMRVDCPRNPALRPRNPELVSRGDKDVVWRSHRIRIQPRFASTDSGVAIPAYRFDKSRADLDVVIDQDAAPLEPGESRRLYCRACRQSITDEGQRVSIDGEHVFVRENPAGFRYCFGCFALAPGCSALGQASAEFTWFNDCRWQIAVCRGCGGHLGWRFMGNHAFFALILDRLQNDDARGH